MKTPWIAAAGLLTFLAAQPGTAWTMDFEKGYQPPEAQTDQGGTGLLGGIFSALGGAARFVKPVKEPPQVGFADLPKKVKESAWDAAFSHDGHTMATLLQGPPGWYLDFWDLTHGANNPPLQGRFVIEHNYAHGFGYSVAVSGDGTTLAVLKNKAENKGLDIEVLRRDGTVVRRIGVPISTARDNRVFSPDNQGHDLYCGLALDAEATRLAVCHKKDFGNEIAVTAMVRDPSVVSVFDLTTGKCLATSPPTPHDGNWPSKVLFDYRQHLEFSPGGRYLSVQGRASIARHNEHRTSRNRKDTVPVTWILDAETLETVDDFGVRRLSGITSKSNIRKAVKSLGLRLPERLVIGNDEKTYAAVNAAIGFWTGTLGETSKTEPFRPSNFANYENGILWSALLAFDPERGLVVGGYNTDRGVVDFLTLRDGKIRVVDRRKYKGERIEGVALHPDAKTVLFARNQAVGVTARPAKNLTDAVYLQAEGFRLLKAGFEAEGGDLLLRSVRMAPELWSFSPLFYDFTMAEEADSGKYPLPVIGRVFLEMHKVLKDVSPRYSKRALFFHTALALRAGHPGIARMGAARLKALAAADVGAPSALIEAAVIAQEGRPDEAYSHLLRELDTANKKQESFWRLNETPNAFKSLFSNRRKLAFVHDKEEGNLGKPQAGGTQVPYPDLDGNMIQPAAMAAPSLPIPPAGGTGAVLPARATKKPGAAVLD